MSALKPSFSTCVLVGLRGLPLLRSSSSISWSMNATISSLSATMLRISANISLFVIISTSFLMCGLFALSLSYIFIIAYLFEFVKSFFIFLAFILSVRYALSNQFGGSLMAYLSPFLYCTLIIVQSPLFVKWFFKIFWIGYLSFFDTPTALDSSEHLTLILLPFLYLDYIISCFLKSVKLFI